MPIQHKQPPTHTYSVCTHKPCTNTHTLLHIAPERGKQKSLTSSCIMCLKCSRETAKQAVTVTALKWGGITQASADSQVKAICDTILDYLCPIEGHFDEIVRKNKLNVQYESWIEFGAKETTNRHHKTAPEEIVYYEVFLLQHNPLTSQKHRTHAYTLTHLSKCSTVSGCASKIASDTKTSLVPKEGEVEPSKPG